MSTLRRKYTLRYLLLGICICIIPTITWATASIQAEVVSGYITQINSDRSVKLDNGNVYYPSRASLNIDIPVGGAVTLKYVAKDGNLNIFFEYAPRLDSLQNSTPNSSGNK